MTTTLDRPTDWIGTLTNALNGIEVITEATQVAKLSQDYYTFSPVLVKQLSGKHGDVVVRPTTEAEVLRVAKACVALKVPLTTRGAGTGNYGQCVPLEGGVIVDVSKMQQIHWIRPGVACVDPGVKMAAFDKKAREQGWELRMVPSTYRTATIGGFVGGGSGGIGSVTYGQLRDRGNVHAVRVVTMEDEPRVLSLRGNDVQKVNHAYGTNGIITQLEMPLAPAYAWSDMIVAFDDFMQAAQFAKALCYADGITKKLSCALANPLPSYFTALSRSISPGKHVVLAMIAEPSLECFMEMVTDAGGDVCYQKTPEESSKGIMLLEYTWNHTTLHARSVDPSLTYLQTLFPDDPDLSLVRHMYEYFGEEVMMHIEFCKLQGRVAPIGLQVVRFSTEDRLNEIIRYHEDKGAFIFNPHTYVLEDGGMKTIDPVQLAFKEEMDPYGLLNPGKMRAWTER